MVQFNLFDNKDIDSDIIKVQNGEFIFLPAYFDRSIANHYFQKLLSNIKWEQEEMRIYGKTVKFPRLTAWYGDNDKPYTFSGITLNPNIWTSELREIKMEIETQCLVIFNSVLVNLYRNGHDSIGWHTDAEMELGINPVIASVNFGATRMFQLRHIETKEKIEIELTHGSLLIMQGELQHFWQHQVPKTSIPVGERINLTYRVII